MHHSIRKKKSCIEQFKNRFPPYPVTRSAYSNKTTSHRYQLAISSSVQLKTRQFYHRFQMQNSLVHGRNNMDLNVSTSPYDANFIYHIAQLNICQNRVLLASYTDQDTYNIIINYKPQHTEYLTMVKNVHEKCKYCGLLVLTDKTRGIIC